MPPRAVTPPRGKWLTEEQAAEKTGFTVAALKKWRKENRGPDYLKGDGDAHTSAVRYPESWIDEWAESRRVRMTA